MTCRECGFRNARPARFCGGCGRPLGSACPACGVPSASDDRFCRACGAALEHRSAGTARGAGGVVRPRARIDTRAALEGERKLITVLFADVKGSLALLEGRDPEEARALVDPVLRVLIDAVREFEGTVNQVLGDGIMALFGAPIAYEDHAVRACLAALRMKERVRQVDLRIGLNSGEVVVRAIASDLHADYTAVGETTHVAARMEQMAAPGTILVTAATARLAEGWIETRPLGPLAVRGLQQPVHAFQLVARRPVASRFDAAAARGLSPFVGRERETSELDAALALAACGRGQVVGVVGEPGVGKSRLLSEWRQRVRAAGSPVLRADAVPHGRSVAYLPLTGLLRRYFGVDPGDDAAAVRARVERALGAEETERFGAPLLALLDVRDADDRWTALDPDVRQRRMVDALRHLLLARSRDQALCMIFEDVHWIDAETQAVLENLVDGLAGAPLMLVLAYRPDYRHAWAGKTYYRQLRVDPLPPASAHELAQRLLGDEVAVDDVVRLLAERTAGNPLFLEETVRHLEDEGVLAGPPGARRLAGSVRLDRTPATVEAVLAARIDRLDPDDKRVLQMAAVIGAQVPAPLLGALAAHDDVPGVDDALVRLEAGEYLRCIRLFPDAQYTFRHALVLDVALAGVLRQRRRMLDRLIVQTLESTPGTMSGEALDRLVHHAVRGELWDRVVHYARSAGQRAFGRSAHRVARAAFEQALAASEHLPDDDVRRRLAVDLRLDLRTALSPLGDSRAQLDVLTEAERLATALGDDRRLGLVCAYVTNLLTLRGDFSGAIRYGERALDLAARADDPAVHVCAHAFLALAHFGRGDYRRAVDVAGRALGALDGPRMLERFGMAQLPAAYLRSIMAWSLAEVGDFARADALAANALAVARNAEQPHSLAFALVASATVHLRRGDADRAVEMAERARATADAADLPAILVELTPTLASAYVAAARVDTALALLDEAVDRAVALRHRLGHLIRTGGFAEAWLVGGRAADALPLARLYVDMTRTVGMRGALASALHLLARAHASVAPPDLPAATAALDEAAAIAADLGMRPLMARCALTRADLAKRAGDMAAARVALDEADAVFDGLGMTRPAL